MGLLKGKNKKRTKTRPTREGFFFVLLSLIIGFAALNTGNNLLYVVFGITLSLVAISGIVSMINISSIEISLDSHSDIYALTPGYLWISVKNKKSFIPSYSVTIEIQKSYYYLESLGAGENERMMVRSFFKDRGPCTLPSVSVSTRYPFGFFKKWVSSKSTEKILVFPKLSEKTESREFTGLKAGENISGVNGRSSELKSLKNYSQGDSLRDIHWKISAKADRLITKQYFSENSRTVRIDFRPAQLNSSELEKYISQKASTYINFLKKGYDVEFVAPDKKFISVARNLRDKSVLTYLAMYGKVNNVAA